MSPVLGTWLIWALAVLCIQHAKAEIRIMCPSVQIDFYPGVKPQSSLPPYVINVTTQNGRSVHEDRFNGPIYDPGQNTYTISLNGIQTGNEKATFIGFIINVYNEFEDEESGHFVTPLPQGVAKEQCHYKARSYINEVVKSTTTKEWTSLQVKWMSPKKYPAGKITISASVVKESGVYWDGITLTLGYICAVPGCYIPGGCGPRGLARTKFGCETCTCAGAVAISVRFTSLLVIVFTLLYNLI